MQVDTCLCLGMVWLASAVLFTHLGANMHMRPSPDEGLVLVTHKGPVIIGHGHPLAIAKYVTGFDVVGVVASGPSSGHGCPALRGNANDVAPMVKRIANRTVYLVDIVLPDDAVGGVPAAIRTNANRIVDTVTQGPGALPGCVQSALCTAVLEADRAVLHGLAWLNPQGAYNPAAFTRWYAGFNDTAAVALARSIGQLLVDANDAWNAYAFAVASGVRGSWHGRPAWIVARSPWQHGVLLPTALQVARDKGLECASVLVVSSMPDRTCRTMAYSSCVDKPTTTFSASFDFVVPNPLHGFDVISAGEAFSGCDHCRLCGLGPQTAPPH